MKLNDDQTSMAREIALKRISRRECSSQDIYNKLIQKGISPVLANHTVSELIQQGFIDNERFAKMLTRAQISQGKGPQFIKQKLNQKGIHLEIEEIKVLGEELSQVSEIDQIIHILEKRYPHVQENKNFENKAMQGLMRRGFSYGEIKKAMILVKERKLEI